jgi:class 3 adenylate cyclase/tetratricopeptide (TPR) repeat protein
VKCPRCQTENREGLGFCEDCGARFAVTCSACGTELTPGKKFCGSCGASTLASGSVSRFASPETYTPKHLAEKILTSKSALEGERKQVTVLFADMKGSMELLVDRDPEDARKILDPVLERMMEAVHRYEGTVNQVMGDGIMALFGAPLAHEDHAVRACYAALRMQQTVMRYGDEVQRSHGVPIQIRVGLNSGEVVVRSVANDLHVDYTAVGQTTHLAARMEQTAKAGSILATGDTVKLVEGYVRAEPIGAVNVKGLSKPVEAYEIVGAGPVRTRMQAIARRGLTRFVGRDTELQTLGNSLEKAAAGNGQIVAVIGEPGVGKSRLLWEFTHSPETRGWLILESAAVSYGQTTAYLPIVELLRAYFKIQDWDDRRQIRERMTGKLLTLDKTLDSVLPALLGLFDVAADNSEWQALDPPRRRQRTLDALSRLVIRESQVQPVALLFEDLHWVDWETQAVLDCLVESLPAARVLLLVDYRPEYQHGWGTKPYYTDLRLESLALESTKQLLDSLLGDDPGLLAVKQLMTERTQGNPFFLEETVRALIETQFLVGDRGTYRLAKDVTRIQVAPTIQAVLAARIDRLSIMPKKLLQCAAVVGKDVPFALLEAIAELPEAELHSGLAELQASEFLHQTGIFPDPEYTFKHALTHEVAYAGILRPKRRDLHARIAEALERLHPDPTPHAERLAHHASAGEVWKKAVLYFRQAGSKALARSAHRHAASHFEQALAALQHLQETPEVLEQAIDLRFDLRNSLHPIGELQRALAYLRDAEGLAHTLKDQRRLGWVSVYMSAHLWQIGATIAALACAERTDVIAETLADRSLQVAGNFYVGQACFILGDYQRAETVLQKNIQSLQGDRSRELLGLAGLPFVLSGSYLAWTLAEQGDFVNALRHGQDAVGFAQAADHRYSLILASWRLACVYSAKGELSNAVHLLERALALCRDSGLKLLSPYMTWSLGSAYTLTGRITDGLSALHEAVDTLETSGLGAFHSLAITRLAEACAMAGRYEEARAYGKRALSLTRERGERGFEAYALRALGDVESYSPHLQAETPGSYYREAAALARELGMRPLIAHCHLSLGKLYRRTGKQQEAQEALTIATTMYREMDMRFWLGQAGSNA